MFLALATAAFAASFEVAGAPYHILPAGSADEGTIEIHNRDAEPLRAAVYLEPTEGDHSNVGWVRFTPRVVVVEPGQRVVVPYRVEVPADAPASAVYESRLVVETTPPDPVWPPPADTAPVAAPAFRELRLVTYVNESGK